MSISLFPHNQTAYDALTPLLETKHRACIIHPTGTGKSFIGFKLCEEHADKTVCWLSPSEYIFQTQLENLRQASGGYSPENIRFFTYAKLMLMEKTALSAIRPDYIILDEFHRCGAELWGQGVQRLLRLYPDAAVLGLTATNIRYLDNQRDMADELFDGNVASEITLGEAIVRGILNPPKYVLSVFSYQSELEKYEKRIRAAKSKAVRDAANQYFEALRRAIEKAKGLDEIFARHMTAKAGKYLVFCSNAAHMDEMIGKAPEWFSGVDAKPHIYRAYTNDPGTAKAFAEFKADDSGHLKLLFSVDMLNEGIHVDDVDGVILFRPTVSPIVYKQQIGRAMSASKKKDAVIFDIVNNIENLYAIGAVETEMRAAMIYYRSFGEGKVIVNDHFRVFDEVRDVQELFEKLNDTLTASWELMYGYASAYFREHGNLEVPRRYKTPDGNPLGQWVFTQRSIYNGERYGKLNEERIRKLEEIGMVWDNMRDFSWNRYYKEAEAYYRKHGNLRVRIDYTTGTGLPLGKWIANQRLYRKNNIQAASLTPERISALDRIGMLWDVPDYLWVRNYALLTQYHREHGTIQLPGDYVTEDGVRLGAWVCMLRRIYNGNAKGSRPLSEEQIRQLNELGMVWNPRAQKWDEGYAHAEKYYNSCHDLNVPATYKCADGFALGRWLTLQRENRAAGKLSPGREEKLNALGILWKKTDPWETGFRHARQYFETHGKLNVSCNYVCEDGYRLGRWIAGQKAGLKGSPHHRVSETQKKRLDEIGMVWDMNQVRREDGGMPAHS